jgi:hypothetical protein
VKEGKRGKKWRKKGRGGENWRGKDRREGRGSIRCVVEGIGDTPQPFS